MSSKVEQLRAQLNERILVLDGGMGTMIQSYRLNEADFRGERFADWPCDLKGNNDLLVLSKPEVIAAIHNAYFEAGASVDPVTGRLKNATGADNATKVSLQLRDGSSTSYDVIKAGDASQSTKTTFVTYDATEGTATLPYAVEYYAEDATTAGKVNSSVVYSLMYK